MFMHKILIICFVRDAFVILFSFFFRFMIFELHSSLYVLMGNWFFIDKELYWISYK